MTTRNNNIKTDSFNLNFIFLTEEDKLNQLYHIYSLLPLLLFYANEIIETAMKSIAQIEEENFEYRKIIGYLAWAEERYMNDETRIKEFNKVYKELKSKMKTNCPKCNKVINFNLTNMKSFCLTETISCLKCGTKIENYSINI